MKSFDRQPIHDLDDLYKKCAMILKDMKDFRDKHNLPEGEELETLAGKDKNKSSPPNVMLAKEYNFKKFLETVAAYPEYSEFISTWGVEIEGFDVGLDPARTKDGYEALEKALDSLGGMSQAVKLLLDKEGYIVDRLSANENDWSIEVICQEDRANELCEKLHESFAKAIGIGLVVVRKYFYGYTVPNIGEDNASKYLEDNEDDKE